MKRFFLGTVLCFFGSTLYAQMPVYQMGEGIKVGTLPLYVGGYFSVDYQDSTNAYRSLTLSELAIMAYGEHQHFSYLFELEAEDVYNEIYGDEDSEEIQKSFHIERLYLRYDWSESEAIEVGKFISPVGLWNRIPINVLRDTTSDPVISETLFPKFTTGVDIIYATQNEYSAVIEGIVQTSEDMDKIINSEIYNNFNVDRQLGLGLSFQDEKCTYQFNAGYFRIKTAESYGFISGALSYKDFGFKLQSEIGTQFNNDGSTMPYIGYIQTSYTVFEKHEAILRFESYDDRLNDIKDSFAVLGYAYRPFRSIALKGEYQRHSLHQENEILLSVSMLF